MSIWFKLLNHEGKAQKKFDPTKPYQVQSWKLECFHNDMLPAI